ncbi:hypothetical protein [Corynebacterium sp. 13CS0277]|uniref:hypothetical protein n=1 Tax=Corynebacterium sp. 13CS0277 TaxID=2071994 RepID=UPI0011B20683|nr:hypothetical protein [Corynebacterium sp. 13CS0277]
MLMTPAGKQGIATRYGYIAMATVASAFVPFVVGAVVLLLPLLGQNSLQWQFIVPPLIAVAGFVCGSTAVGLVVSVVARSVPLIARIVISGGISVLCGVYSGTFGFLWPLGVWRYSDSVESPQKLWAAGLSLLLGVIAVLGAVALLSRSADPFSSVAALSALPVGAAVCGVAIGLATSSLPVEEPQLLCNTTNDPNISVCVNSAQQPALQHSIDSANQALAVVGSLIPEEKVVYTPIFGQFGESQREINFQPWQHNTALGNNLIESVVSTAACNGDERPDAAYLNASLNAHLLAAAGLNQRVGTARDASGRSLSGGDAEGGSLYGHSGDPFADTPIDVITAAIAAHRVEIAECTGQWEWFGVTPQ